MDSREACARENGCGNDILKKIYIIQLTIGEEYCFNVFFVEKDEKKNK
ncbi:MAG: hypothetical protein V3U15_02850 [Nitrospinota bacterium]